MNFRSMLCGVAFAVAAAVPLCVRADAKYYRYSDHRQLYYIENNRIYRYSDHRQILYYDGDDRKLVVFMVLMLADM